MIVTTIALSRGPCIEASELTDTSRSKHAKLRAVGLGQVQWTNGFWAERFAICRDRSVPAMWELMRGTKYKPFYQHFLIAAGELEGDYHGAAWNDGDFYKWIEGTDYFYVNPLRNESPLPTRLRWSRTRVPFVTSYCCPPNVVRTVAQVNGYAFTRWP